MDWFGLSCLWIVGMANAINLIDGLDGLASGITLAGLLAVSVVGYLAGISSVTWMSTLLIGCLLGFWFIIVDLHSFSPLETVVSLLVTSLGA